MNNLARHLPDQQVSSSQALSNLDNSISLRNAGFCLLLVEGNHLLRLACKRALEDYHGDDWHIIEAETGNQGLKLARTQQPHCVVVDQLLPDMEGSEFLAELAEVNGRQAPVVMLTDLNNVNNTNKLIQPEAFAYVLKGTDTKSLNTLSSTVSQVLREHQALLDKAAVMARLHEIEAQYRTLVEQIPAITYIASLETPGKLLYVSPQINQLGFPATEWLEQPKGLFKQIYPDDLAVTIEAYAQTYEHHIPLSCEYRLVKSNGQPCWYLDEAYVVFDECGNGLFIQGVLIDIEKDKETEIELQYYRQRLEEMVQQRTEQLEKQCSILKIANANLDKVLSNLKNMNADHDPLTGLLNRTNFEERVTRVMNSIQMNQSEHVLCHLKIDQFKSVNDRQGSLAADELLVSMAALLSSRLRHRDTLARFGNDEFFFMLEHTRMDHALTIANEICKCVRNFRFIWNEHPVPISASIGLTSLTFLDSHAGAVLSGAETACNLAKKNGGNRVYIFR